MKNGWPKMRPYRLKLLKRVKHQIQRLPGRYRQRVKALIQSLRDEPRPPEAIPLRDRHQLYRIRLDDIRIVYSIDDDLLLIEVVKTGKKTGPEFYDDV